MVVLSAIGRFFKKIWDWIKQTAWIQPLLIVGIIFAVIFSIPSIVKAAKSSKAASAKYNTYYHNFKLSFDNEANSEVDDFTTKLAKAIEGDDTEFKNTYGDRFGEKFFVAYVAKDCDKCEDAKEGFSTFEKKFNNNESFMSATNTNEKFHLVTIFADDENNDTTENQTAFVKYLERHQGFFEDVGSVAYETPYYNNNKLNDSDLEALETADPDNFLTPTIFLVELGETAAANKQIPGVTEIMFGVEGSDKNDKARTLLDCWNHTGDFSYNKDIK